MFISSKKKSETHFFKWSIDFIDKIYIQNFEASDRVDRPTLERILAETLHKKRNILLKFNKFINQIYPSYDKEDSIKTDTKNVPSVGPDTGSADIESHSNDSNLAAHNMGSGDKFPQSTAGVSKFLYTNLHA